MNSARGCARLLRDRHAEPPARAARRSGAWPGLKEVLPVEVVEEPGARAAAAARADPADVETRRSVRDVSQEIGSPLLATQEVG